MSLEILGFPMVLGAREWLAIALALSIIFDVAALRGARSDFRTP